MQGMNGKVVDGRSLTVRVRSEAPSGPRRGGPLSEPILSKTFPVGVCCRVMRRCCMLSFHSKFGAAYVRSTSGCT